MKSALASVCAILLLMGITPTETKASTNASVTVDFQSPFLLSDVHHPVSVIRGGDSSETLRIERERARSRVLLARVGRTQSYTGRGTPIILSKDAEFFNCVSYAKEKAGIYYPIGSGGRSAINSSIANVGSIGVERGTPHAVYIEKVEGDQITISESNYIKGYITQRTLQRSDFIGFITGG